MGISSRQLRIGQGVDVHPFAEGRPLILGGLRIPHSRGLLGHSDADALLHAVTDALLGASGQGDIGTRFPSSDNRWKDADSSGLLGAVWTELAAAGWSVVNIDCSLLAEEPRLAPYIEPMRERLCSLLGIEKTRCAIKATTTEKMGFVGRERG